MLLFDVDLFSNCLDMETPRCEFCTNGDVFYSMTESHTENRQIYIFFVCIKKKQLAFLA